MKNFVDFLSEQGIVACDSSTVRLYSDALNIAPTEANVLILGGSGTGKDCLAKFIHNRSRRAHAPFVHINCSAVPGGLFESEFFGYEPGTFTGGTAAGQRGLIAAADGGTLFLDEIGELDLGLQTKLLQVVQEHRVRSLGSTENRPVNIRLIAATNRNLPQMIKEGTFRLDLYYRLNVVFFEIPPLSQRRQDIRGLIRRLSKQYGQMRGYEKTFTREAMDFLMAQDWLGNIRELQNFMEKLYVLEDSQVITDTLLRKNYQFSKLSKQQAPAGPCFKPLKWAVAEFERQYIGEVLQNSHTQEEAAAILGIDRACLNQKLREL